MSRRWAFRVLTQLQRSGVESGREKPRDKPPRTEPEAPRT